MLILPTFYLNLSYYYLDKNNSSGKSVLKRSKMIKEAPQIIREWLLHDDIETLSYQVSELMLSSGYQIIESHSTKWENNTVITWVLNQGLGFLRSFDDHEKLYFEMTSFNHKNHLTFVIGLKSLILSNSGDMLR